MSRLLIVVVLFALPAAAAENWPEFRGPKGNGDAGSSRLPLKFDEDQNIRWKREIHGKGWSSPVVWGDQLWVTTATEDGKKMYAVCLNRNSGDILHDILLFENDKPRFCHPTNSYASCTPVIEKGRVYLHFGSYGTACVNTESGTVLWKQMDLPCNHWRGPGSSPVLHGDKLFVAYDGYDLQYVVALNKANGKIAWKKNRDIDYGTDNGDRKKAYGTCTIVTHKGKHQVISPSATETISYDTKTGKEFWRVRHGGMNAASRPLFGNGLIYIAAGQGTKSLIAVQPDGKIAWSLGKAVPRRPSQLLLGDHLFMINDDGVASCVNAKTGETAWRERLGGKYRASPIHANGRIYFFALNGEVPVIEASTKSMNIVARNQLANGFQASPAVVGNSLYVRTTKHLYCVESK